MRALEDAPHRAKRMVDYPVLEHSKSEVRRAVKQLVANDISVEEKRVCINTLANFRSAHAYPMQSTLGYFRKKAFEVDDRAIIVRRLKRIPSIINKIKRMPKMQVTRMGDIGGVRIITKNLKNVQKIRDEIRKGRTRNKFSKEMDYLKEPKKSSGYRGIHLTYSYQGSKESYKGFRVELQIRSQVQHAWATTVEVAGTFLNQSLKASEGDQEWLEFFKVVSLAFACLEKEQPIPPEIRKQVISKAEELKVADILRSCHELYKVTTDRFPERSGFYLLSLDTKAKRMKARYFNDSLLSKAMADYRRLEQEIAEDNTQDAVLVSAASFSALKKAYPNYFADTELFLRKLGEVSGNESRYVKRSQTEDY